jgi:hypothetical protein
MGSKSSSGTTTTTKDAGHQGREQKHGRGKAALLLPLFLPAGPALCTLAGHGLKLASFFRMTLGPGGALVVLETAEKRVE